MNLERGEWTSAVGGDALKRPNQYINIHIAIEKHD